MGYRNPLVLAQALTTIDVLSGGRLIVGFGQGWSKGEFDAVGASMVSRAGMADEFLQALKAIWTDNPVEFNGKHFQIPASYIDIKPVQKPHPPIYLAAYAPAAMQRVATMGNGWMPAGIPLESLAQMMNGIRGMASQAGRNASELKMIVRTNIEISENAVGPESMVFTGSLDEIKADITSVKDMGADEVFLDPLFSPEAATAEGILGVMEQFQPSALAV
jgi:alkanesulfonate monooxygenase SsuD/methylene tetrahydromethanopterin reductase-like flavin-dependent oxidoreductase (luciferase family)